jgi:hypothetical protein
MNTTDDEETTTLSQETTLKIEDQYCYFQVLRITGTKMELGEIWEDLWTSSIGNYGRLNMLITNYLEYLANSSEVLSHIFCIMFDREVSITSNIVVEFRYQSGIRLIRHQTYLAYSGAQSKRHLTFPLCTCSLCCFLYTNPHDQRAQRDSNPRPTAPQAAILSKLNYEPFAQIRQVPYMSSCALTGVVNNQAR